MNMYCSSDGVLDFNKPPAEATIIVVLCPLETHNENKMHKTITEIGITSQPGSFAVVSLASRKQTDNRVM
jgi:hypothetical protein